jgi:very-short-patch-repair endonuclease
MRERARQLRANHTRAELLLWAHLRRRRLGGLWFRRQQPIGRYIVDFYCHAARLAIELDGSQHAEPAQLASDRARDAFLASLGLRILRFTNAEVLSRLDAVLEHIHHLALTDDPPAR